MRTKKHRGGSSTEPSAWSYVYNTVGDGLTQFRNALTVQPDENIGTIQSNDIEPKSNLNAQNAQGLPTQNNLSLIQSAGKRRRRKGGNMGFIVNQALAPISLLALQQGYSKKYMKKSKGKKTMRSKSRRYRRSRK
jgi:hypothetical protein